MKRIILYYSSILITVIILGVTHRYGSAEQFTSYTINPQKDSVALYWKNKEGKMIRSFKNLSAFT